MPQKERKEKEVDKFMKAVKMFKEWFELEEITEKNVWNLDFVIGRFASRYLELFSQEKEKWVEERKGNIKLENEKITIITNDVENLNDLIKYLKQKWAEEIKLEKKGRKMITGNWEHLSTTPREGGYNQAVEDLEKIKQTLKNK